MRKFLKYCFSLLIVAVAGVGFWWFQPWAAYSPSSIASTLNPESRVENMRSMERLYPHRFIKASNKPTVWPVASGVNTKAPLDISYDFDGKTTTVSAFLNRSITTGLVVIKDGEIVREHYFQGETATDRHTSWSVAKSFTITLVGMAVDEGLIASIDDPVATYLPALKDTAYGAASIKDVLQMSSGVTFTESYGVAEEGSMPISDAQKVLYKTYLFGTPMNDLLAAYGKLEEPGTRFDYRSGDTHILGWLVSTLYGKPLDQLLQEKIWQPLGMTSDASWLLDGSTPGDPIGFCCLQATVRDFAKLGELFRLGGAWQGKQLISKDWVRAATTPDADHLMPGTARPDRGYAYQWWVPADFDREYFAAGIWGQYIWVDEKAGVVIARTSVDPNFTANMGETIAVMRAITDHVVAGSKHP